MILLFQWFIVYGNCLLLISSDHIAIISQSILWKWSLLIQGDAPFLVSSEVFWRSFIFDHFLMTSSLCSGVAQYCSSLTLIRDLRHISPRDSCLIVLSSLQSCLVTLPSFLLDEVFICHSDKFGDLAVICSSCTFHVLFRRASWTFIPLLSLGK